jgi:hypothetical protein
MMRFHILGRAPQTVARFITRSLHGALPRHAAAWVPHEPPIFVTHVWHALQVVVPGAPVSHVVSSTAVPMQPVPIHVVKHELQKMQVTKAL